MAAESPIRTKLNTGSVVLPQHVIDPTILDGVAGFINDLVPAAYNVPTENKDQIQWVKFERIGLDELGTCNDFDKGLPAPLLLTLGYSTGIQIWAVPATGEAKEILSWRHGSVKVLTILPNPDKIGSSTVDNYAPKRPLIALCDNVAPGNDFCSLSFISLKTSEQVKLIKFKNPILDVVANKRSVVVTFLERIAVFDALTFEDRVTVTTCYLSPGIYQNPVALGTRWLAYAENKLIPSRRSSGGNDGEGVQSYTATVLHAAKSLGRGLRELSDAVASSLTGNTGKPGPSTPVQGDIQQKGIVTILDIEKSKNDESLQNVDSIIAHFTAHKEAIVYLNFDPSGLLLLTADKRGYDFHLFRIQPHPAGPALAAVHHLYILHRGDTTARVQDMCFSPDSRWVTVSTLRGTTHVFPVTPYGGNVGVRTHATPHVVNKMSRFHRSAGLTAEGRSNSPVSSFEMPSNSNLPYHNPRLPPYPHPTVVQPLAQIRQPLFIPPMAVQSKPTMSRQRSGSSSDDNSVMVMRVSACFAPARAWIESPSLNREPVLKAQVKPVESLFIISLHGSLVQYDLEPKSSSSVPKEKVCDDTLIELAVTAKAQWVLQRSPTTKDVQLPISLDTLSLISPDDRNKKSKAEQADDKWLSQVEIVTHAGPHRRLWMGPQFTFKTYNNGAGSSINIMDTQAIEIGRSKPVNMPISAAYPILIEAGSVSSCEPSPKLFENLQKNYDDKTDNFSFAGEMQLREDLADAMQESSGVRDAGGRCVIVSMKTQSCGGGGSASGSGMTTCGVAKVVNPLGMVVTLQSDDDSEVADASHNEEIIHENCDEALFRPVVASKAVVFAEPKNVRTKIATNVLHHNKIVISNSKADLLGKTKEDSLIECRKEIKKDACKSSNNKNKFGGKQADRLVQKENEVPQVQEAVKDTDVPNNKAINSKKKKDKEPKKKLIDLPSIESYDQLIVDHADKLCDGFDLSTFDPVRNKTPEFTFASKEATVELLQDSFFDASEACQDIEIIKEQSSFAQEFDIENDFNIPVTTTVDVFDSCPENLPDIISMNVSEKEKDEDNDKDIVSSSEDTTQEDKQYAKKQRKPKAKLGVRIGNSARKLWNTCTSETKFEDYDIQPEFPPLEEFTFTLPTMNYSKALKESTEKVIDTIKTEDVFENPREEEQDATLLKIDKTSDENSSSQTETTESDDSASKLPAVIMDVEEFTTQQVEVKPKTNSNKNKKSKKKRR